MPKKNLGTFEIPWYQVLDEEGHCDESLAPSLSDKELQRLYEWMVLTRTFDEKALNLQREGRLGTYAPVLGQEAAQVGSAYALHPSDWMFPSFRELGVFLVRGLPMRMIFQYWSGDERGSEIPQGENDLPVAIPVGTHIPHAVGTAIAAKLKGDPIAVIVYFGDGATSKGDFHEGMNFAGLFKAPIVFLCQNNHWAISVPLKQQTASATLAQKAIAYNFPGIAVDGNDVLGVYKVTREALERARQGEGPTLIECITYRMGDHTTADDASRYRPKDEVAYWKRRDPIDRFRLYLEQRRLWNRDYEEEVRADSVKQVQAAVHDFESLPPAPPEDFFYHLFQEMTPPLKEQLERFKEKMAKTPRKGADR